jgi:hypothetical protein
LVLFTETQCCNASVLSGVYSLKKKKVGGVEKGAAK